MISYFGPLFATDANISPQIRRAAQKAAAYGRFRAQARTPVATGLLRRSTEVKLEGRGIRMKNDTPYARYVHNGTKRMPARRFISDTLPETKEVFRLELQQEIGRKLGADIIGNLASSTKLTDGRKGFKGTYKEAAAFEFKGLKKYEKRFGKARPSPIGKLDSAKARKVGAI